MQLDELRRFADSDRRFLVLRPNELFDLRDLTNAIDLFKDSVKQSWRNRLLNRKNHSSSVLSASVAATGTLQPMSQEFILTILQETVKHLRSTRKRIWSNRQIDASINVALSKKNIPSTAVRTLFRSEIVRVKRQEASYRKNPITSDSRPRIVVFSDGSTLFDGWLEISEFASSKLPRHGRRASISQFESDASDLVLKYFNFAKGLSRRRLTKLIAYYAAKDQGISFRNDYVALVPKKKYHPAAANNLASKQALIAFQKRKEEEARVEELKRQEAARRRAEQEHQRNQEKLRKSKIEQQSNQRRLWVENCPQASIDSLTPPQAEELAANWMRHLGVKDARKTKNSNDGGLDVTSSTWLAEVKHYVSPVGPEPVRKLNGVLFGLKGAFFTRTGYTKSAIAFANRSGIALFVYKDNELVAHSVVARKALQSQSLLF